jgi:carboxymethylenebutenolidase
MREELVTVTGRNGSVPLLVFEPEDTGSPVPAIVIGAEAYGLNEFTHRVASDLCEAGYAVVVPDYYRGNGLEAPDDYIDITEVVDFIDRLDFRQATLDVLEGIDYARRLHRVDPARVVVWGYCTGGTLTMLASSLDRDLAASVWFFPSQPTFPELGPKRPVQPIDLLWSVRSPVLVLYGDQDAMLVEIMPEIRRRLEEWGVSHDIRIYPGAGHAFSAPVPPLRNELAATSSWRDALEFVSRHTSKV